MTAAAVLFAITVAGVWLWSSDWSKQLDAETLIVQVQELGAMGPLAIIALMIVAVVASPIPSAPIALAAGAVFGQVAGTIYVAIGAEIGALFAFMIARLGGRSFVERLLGKRAELGLLGSQNALTLAIFVSRLLPFISFDAMSYAAGLSRLHLWRFLLATLAGILPASFALAYLGAGAMSGQFGPAAWIALGLGLLTALPILATALHFKPRASSSSH
ncbi:VTT domain-containing protein [Aliiroseovarius sp. KMU-50]|uniref:TVP38/TMEM64 family membrane protein n=1 Tax=Aliiroseovarius salicola TaxID=3009082 RepID=A0ABT4W6L1_9RHOB|nr:VTT domain-containing protein [Aliiroseovarius sp. KMU-50]MDA5095785.1 VTT domain-containing protein [Aliiroseovarius sp. KMU-50]